MDNTNGEAFDMDISLSSSTLVMKFIHSYNDTEHTATRLVIEMIIHIMNYSAMSL